MTIFTIKNHYIIKKDFLHKIINSIDYKVYQIITMKKISLYY